MLNGKSDKKFLKKKTNRPETAKPVPTNVVAPTENTSAPKAKKPTKNNKYRENVQKTPVVISQPTSSESKELKKKAKKRKAQNEALAARTLALSTPKPSKIEKTEFFKDEFIEEKTVEEELEPGKKPEYQSVSWINKQRTMVVASRGVSHSERYIMNDLIDLMPQAKKEVKIEKNVAKYELNEICFNHNCNNCIYFEHRRREFIMWLFRSPEGPCVKFQVRNVHTVSDIRLLGNCLKYSRPLLSFDKTFDELPHLKLLKEMFIHAFNTPKNHPKSKPFYDHVLCFYNVGNNIFFRNYQILNELKERFCDSDDADKLQLVEIGPRFALTLIRIFDGPLGGKTLYANQDYVPPRTLIRRNNFKFVNRKNKDEKEHREVEKALEKEDNPRKWLEA